MSGCRRFLPDFFEEFHRLRHCFIQIWLYLERPNIWILLQVSFYFSLCRPKSLLDVFARCAFSRDLGSGSFLDKKRLPGAWNRTPPPLKPDFLIAGKGWKSLRRRDERIRGDTGNGDVELSHRVSSKKHKKFWWVLVFVPSLCIFHRIKTHFPILRKNLEGAEFLWLIMVVIHLGPPGGLNLGSGDP